MYKGKVYAVVSSDMVEYQIVLQEVVGTKGISNTAVTFQGLMGVSSINDYSIDSNYTSPLNEVYVNTTPETTYALTPSSSVPGWMFTGSTDANKQQIDNCLAVLNSPVNDIYTISKSSSFKLGIAYELYNQDYLCIGGVSL